jgi:hypothetical protein
MVPDFSTTVATGDHLLVVNTAETQEATETRLRQVSQRGRLAGWLNYDA